MSLEGGLRPPPLEADLDIRSTWALSRTTCRYTPVMHSRPVQHWAILALVVASVAMILGGGAAGTSQDTRETGAAASSSVTSSVRLPDVIVRSEADREDLVFGKLAGSVGLLCLVAISVSSLLALLARARRRGRRSRRERVSRPAPLRHALTRRAPPVLQPI